MANFIKPYNDDPFVGQHQASVERQPQQYRLPADAFPVDRARPGEGQGRAGGGETLPGVIAAKPPPTHVDERDAQGAEQQENPEELLY